MMTHGSSCYQIMQQLQFAFIAVVVMLGTRRPACAQVLGGGGGVGTPPPPLGKLEINHVSFVIGSPLGSQRLAVEGDGFVTNHADGANTVEVGRDDLGWVPCRVVEGACTVDCGSSSRIVCDTAPVPPNLSDALVSVAPEDEGEALDVRVTVCRSGCSGTDKPKQSTITHPASFRFVSERDSAVNPTLVSQHSALQHRASSAWHTTSLTCVLRVRSLPLNQGGTEPATAVR
jgi:hypothetical protein